jgi:hypothetical protein
VPRSIARRALAALRESKRGARTVAIFCSETDLQHIELSADLPVVHPRTGYFDARWGRPYLAPFLFALDCFPRYAVSYVDHDHWRLFEVFLGEIAELDLARRVEVGDSPSVPPSPAALQMWYRLTGQRVRELMRQRSIGSLVLMGPDQRVAEFAARLHPSTQQAVVATLPGLSRPEASATEVLGRAMPIMAETETRRCELLLDEAARSGVLGVPSSIQATLRGELQCLLVPWTSDARAFVDPRSGEIAGEKDAAHTHRYPLRDVAAELASRGHTRLEFVEDAAQQRRLDALGGMAGLRKIPDVGNQYLHA